MKSEAATMPAASNRVADFLALTKPRLNSLVVVTAGVGYYLGAVTPDLAVALHVLVGSALVAGGAAAFNQVAERDIDEVMLRTRLRPVAAGRLTPTEGRLFAAALSVAGLIELALRVNTVAALVALATLISYAGIYTPLKRRTAWATLVGAVPGALPPVIGWTAARGALTVEAWILFGIVFLWQLPHFHALSWLYREDFGRAGLPLVATQGPRGAAHGVARAPLCRGARPAESGPDRGRDGRAAACGGSRPPRRALRGPGRSFSRTALRGAGARPLRRLAGVPAVVLDLVARKFPRTLRPPACSTSRTCRV